MGGKNLSEPINRLPRKQQGPWALAQRVGIAYAFAVLLMLMIGICGCTVFSMASLLLVAGVALGIGNSGFGALTGEREKKTLDSLRLTQMSAHQVLLHKLQPEFTMLGAVLAYAAPTVLLSGWWAGYGLKGLGVLALAAAAGGFSSVFAIFVSSIFDTTSRAVVAGWVGKAVWLLLTPVLDSVAAAVLVQRTSPTLFTSTNPLKALSSLLVPEAATGFASVLPWATLVILGGLSYLCWQFAARRFEDGLEQSATLSDRRVHGVYRDGWGWLPGVLSNNPFFLREFALQLRSGAGRWPGYAVFLVLFLAPFLYSQSWSAKERVRSSDRMQHRPVVQVSDRDAFTSVSTTQKTTDTRKQVRLRVANRELVLKGHNGSACLRLALHRHAGVPLPAHQLKIVTRSQTVSPEGAPVVERPATADPVTQQLVTARSDQPTATVSSARSRASVSRRSLSVGLAGTVVLLLLYLAIRCSGFLAGAVTGERDRRSWEDLALTGAGPESTLLGKAGGALLMPLLQMTLAFPVLSFFVFSGSFGLFEMMALYCYAVALAVVAGSLGLYTSCASKTSHEAHARGVFVVVLGFTVVPMVACALGGLIGAVSLAMTVALLPIIGMNRRFLAFAGGSVALLLNPLAASPLTGALSFLPTVATSGVGFIQGMGVGAATGALGLLNFGTSMVFMLCAGYLLWSISKERLAEPRNAETLSAEL